MIIRSEWVMSDIEVRCIMEITYRLAVAQRGQEMFCVLLPWQDRLFVPGDFDIWSTYAVTSE